MSATEATSTAAGRQWCPPGPEFHGPRIRLSAPGRVITLPFDSRIACRRAVIVR